MLLAEVARTSAEVAATSARTRKVELLAGCLSAARPDEVAVVVAYLSGELPQRRTGVGYRSLAGCPAPPPRRCWRPSRWTGRSAGSPRAPARGRRVRGGRC